MAENYTVNYNINVQSEKATAALTRFQEAVAGLTTATETLTAFQTKMNSVVTSLSKLSKTAPSIKISAAKGTHKTLDSLINKLERINALVSENKSIVVNTKASKGNGSSGGQTTGAPGGAQGGGKKKESPKQQPNPKGGNKTAPSAPAAVTSNKRLAANFAKSSYKALGPSMIDSGGIGVLNMLKGMGIAYGITGLGMAIGNVVKDAAEYDNIITTTRNILATHDKDKETFNARFEGMERIIRNVGVETKFTAPEVADASKFLAMAGFNLDDINKSIRPIADIALVGDSDLGETADVVTNIMTGYGIDAGGVRRAGDIMANTFTMSNTTLMEIAESYKYAASLLSSAGVSFEEATAAIGILGNAGIKGSQAGTSMRTILANLVNPTKKQKAVWDELGIERFDDKGNLRDLVDIFTDLNKAGLPVDKVYKMFNRTAAQGAIGLIQNVEEWNNIIKENLLSEGVAAELADAKKNTIQGLWAQLTSMFTENGLQAFEGLDGQIREMLQQTIDWLKTPEANTLIIQISKTFMNLVTMVKDFTGLLMSLYQRFSPLIELWLKIQLALSSVLVPLRAFRALINFGSYIKTAVYSLGTLTLQMYKFGASTQAAVSGPLGRFRGLLSGIGASAVRFGGALSAYGNLATLGNISERNVSPEVRQRYAQYVNYHKQKNVSAIAPWTGGIGTMVGSMAGGYLGSEIGGAGSWTSAVGAIGGTLLGGLAGSWLGSTVAPWLTTTAIPFLLTNPVGWAIGIGGALTAGISAFVAYQNAVEDANEANNKYLASTASLNGISLSEHATKSDKYLDLVYNKQLSVNEVISKHIELIKEQLGIIDAADKKLSGKTLGETHKQELDNASKAFGFFSARSAAQDAALAPVVLPNGKIDTAMNVVPTQLMNANGSTQDVYEFHGRYFPDSRTGYKQIAAARFLYGLGRDVSEGSELQKLQQSLNKQILMSASLEDFNGMMSNAQSSKKKSYLTGSENWTIDEIKDKPDTEWKQGYYYVTGFNDMIKQWYDIANPTSANAQMLADFAEVLKSFEKGDVSEELLSRFMLHSGIPIFDEQNFGTFGSDDFMKKLGWYNNQWNTLAYQWINPETGKEETRYLTAEQARQAFLDFHQQIIDLTNRLSPKLRPYFESFLDNPIWNYGGTGNGANGKATYDGVEYQWNAADRMWHPVNNYIRKPLSNKEMQDKLKSTANAGGGNSTGTNTPGPKKINNKGGGGHNGGGAKASDYKSHYNSNAAPKQVIVRIGNLMNVDAVNLSDPNKAAVIKNLKTELAQALVDVVHDFDETWNG